MSLNIEQTVINTLRKLPPEKQQELLDFAEPLHQQSAARVEESTAAPRKSIWEKIEERVKQVPDEVCERVPEDGAEQHDHYLYGAPKK